MKQAKDILDMSKELTQPVPVRCQHCKQVMCLGDVVGFGTESDIDYVRYEEDHYLLCAECLYTQAKHYRILAFLTFLREGE